MVKKAPLKEEHKILAFRQDAAFYQRRALLHRDKNQLLEALDFARRAVELEPENDIYCLDLAELYTEVSEYEESNALLLEVLRHGHVHIAECAFGLGCNYVGMQELQQAARSFEHYLNLQPDGEYAQDAYEYLEMLSEQLRFEEHALQNPAGKLLSTGREQFADGDFPAAIQTLRQAVQAAPQVLDARNMLTMAYYCDKQLEAATRAAEEALALSPSNIYANCNMALLAQAGGDKARMNACLERIQKARTEDPDTLQKIAGTLCELGEYAAADKWLRQLFSLAPYDRPTLHCAAVSNYAQGRFAEAQKLWERILRIHPTCDVATYYVGHCRLVVAGEERPKQLAYHYQVPFEEVVRRITALNECADWDHDKLLHAWQQDEAFRAMLLWATTVRDAMVRKAALALVASTGDARAVAELRKYILCPDQPDETKRDVFILLRKLDAPQPYIAWMQSGMMEVRISDTGGLDEAVPQPFLDVLLRLHEHVEDDSSELMTMAVMAWQRYTRSVSPDFHPIRSVDGWAAALEYWVREHMHNHRTKTSLCRTYGVNMATFNRCLQKLSQELENSPQEADAD